MVNDDRMFPADVYIEDGVIRFVFSIQFLNGFRQIGLNLTIPGGVRVIDVRGKMVMPGKLLRNFHSNCKVVSMHIPIWKCPLWELFPPMISTREPELLWLGGLQ